MEYTLLRALFCLRLLSASEPSERGLNRGAPEKRRTRCDGLFIARFPTPRCAARVQESTVSPETTAQDMEGGAPHRHCIR